MTVLKTTITAYGTGGLLKSRFRDPQNEQTLRHYLYNYFIKTIYLYYRQLFNSSQMQNSRKFIMTTSIKSYINLEAVTSLAS